MSEHRAEARRWFGRGRTRALLSLGVVLGLGAVGTSAYWTDTATITGISISSGSMDLRISQAIGDADPWGAVGPNVGYTASHMTTTNLTPTESVAFNLAVRNVGQPHLTYTATVKQGGTWTYVDQPIDVTVYAGSVSSNTSTYPRTGTCSGSAIGTTRQVSGTAQSVITTARTLTGHLTAPTSGQKEQLCVVVKMRLDAVNGDQTKTGTLEFGFTANQVTS